MTQPRRRPFLHSKTPRRAMTTALAWLACAGACVAHAQDRAVVVVIDSDDRGVRPDAVRAELRDRVELEVISLLDGAREGAIGTLQVAVAVGGHRVELCYQAEHGRRRFTAATAPRGASGALWIAEAAAAFLNREIPDRRWSLPSEVLDPFTLPSGARRGRPAPTEVIDPWEVPWSRSRRRSNEPGTELAPPPIRR